MAEPDEQVRARLTSVGNVNLPTPVVILFGVLLLAAGYLTGAVAGPDAPDRTTATVASFDAATNRLCLEGDGVSELEGAEDDEICGVWQRVQGAVEPKVGDDFRFVSTLHTGQAGQDDNRVTLFGEVAD